MIIQLLRAAAACVLAGTAACCLAAPALTEEKTKERITLERHEAEEAVPPRRQRGMSATICSNGTAKPIPPSYQATSAAAF